MDIDARYMIRRYKKSPFLNIRDKQTDKQYSLKPIKAYENIDQVFSILIDNGYTLEYEMTKLIKDNKLVCLISK